MAQLSDIVFDCAHPASLARFWAAALDDYQVAPYDNAELERLQSIGIDDPEDDPTVLVESSTGGPRLFFQKVPEGKTAKNPVHLDIWAAPLETEVDRLISLGATLSADQPNDNLVVMYDPAGNEFCVVA